MQKITRRSIIASGAALVFLPHLNAAVGQENYPSSAVRFVVPYPPGASTDTLSRVFVRELAKEIQGNVIVDNRPGGGSTIGAVAVRNAPADGHTLLFQADGFFSGKLASPTVGYEFGDFEFIAPLAQTPFVLVVPASLQIESLDDLKKRAMEKNGELDFGALGTGVSLFPVLSEKLAKHLGVTPKMITYKGGAEGLTAIMRGEIDAYFASVALASTVKSNPRVKLVAITSERGQNEFLPGLKSFAELGVSDMQFRAIYGVAIRKETPSNIKTILEKAILKVVESNELDESRKRMSLAKYTGSPSDYRRELEVNLNMYKAYLSEKKS